MIITTAIVLVEEIEHIEAPYLALGALLGDSMPFLLESALADKRFGKYSIIGSNPAIIIRSKNGVTEVVKDGTRNYYSTNPFAIVDEEIKAFGFITDSDSATLPFTGGAVGYFGYDLNRQVETMPNIAEDDQGIPDIYLGFYTEAVVVDHQEGRTYAVSYIPEGMVGRLPEVELRLRSLIAKVGRGRLREGKGIVAENLSSNMSKKRYKAMINKAKEYIDAGDIFQVNLAQRFTADIKVDHYQLYERLRSSNPAPFAAFLSYGDFSILSSSPERFMLVDDRYVETRPIKGTRPRFNDEHKDGSSAKELMESEKDAAEHIMIVDVERNDLGRVCEYGSVKAPELMVVESYKTVHHLVSTVTGRLRPEVGMMDLLQASFPGGSISGAPKIRAMEIIEELEPCRRNIYTGAIGYISTNRKMDTNIAIRTITAVGRRAYLHVGGGIVADSDPDMEYQETLDKGHALCNALGLVQHHDVTLY
ncbi:MAG TPA: aminodeoxychorismate synthase component I [Anaerolineae bacterium]|nr:aminodeoxychorismate synthase component I [Anaerolineae bacterium]